MAVTDSFVVYNQILKVPFDSVDPFEQIIQTAHTELLNNNSAIRADVTADLGDEDQFLLTLVVENEESLQSVLTARQELTSELNDIEGIESQESEQYNVICPEYRAGLRTRLKADEPEVLFLKNHVHVWVVEGKEEEFIEASKLNVAGSLEEPGIARFDLIRDKNDASHFALIEVFKNAEAPGEHKKTEHYLTWRATVADWMAKPRSAMKTQCTIFPQRESAWDSHLEDLTLRGIEESLSMTSLTSEKGNTEQN